MPNHSVLSDLQPVSLVKETTAPHRGQHHLVPLFIVQIDTGFHAVKPLRYFVHNAFDQLVEIKDGRDRLRRLLDALQLFRKIARHRLNWPEREFVAGETGYRRHGNLSLREGESHG